MTFVYGDDVTGFTLRDLDISGATRNGVFLTGTNSGDILNVVANFNGEHGFVLVDTFGGTISGNTASGNGINGIQVNTFTRRHDQR